MLRQQKLLQVIGLLVILLFSRQAHVASAHGGDSRLQLENMAAGPYLLTVRTSPAVLRVGKVHVEIAVLDSAGLPVVDVPVVVRVSSLDNTGSTLTTIAHSPVQGNHVWQEASLHLEEPGRYRVVVTVGNPEGADGRLAFDIQVTSVSTAMKLLIYVAILVSLVATLWILQEGVRTWLRWREKAAVPPSSVSSRIHRKEIHARRKANVDQQYQ